MSFESWIGREQSAADRLDGALAQRWLATFNLRADNTVMPQGIHFCLCTPTAPTNMLGEDGHPVRHEDADSFLPPIALPRRMWASSAMTFHAPIAIGAAIQRTSRIAAIEEKDGSSGKLAFVDVEHETRADGTVAVRETQTLVYREAVSPETPLNPPKLADAHFEAGDWDHVRTLTPDPRLLFRFSALTFNTHRIHYDAPYARDVERYRGLVVHGPLMASLLLQMLAEKAGENRTRRFEFRAISPAIAGEPLHLAMRESEGGFDLAACANDGRKVMRASAAI